MQLKSGPFRVPFIPLRKGLTYKDMKATGPSPLREREIDIEV
jgi:hypothetical protein